MWSDGQVWCSPEQHGNITSVFKNQIDWIPLSDGSVWPTQGRTLGSELRDWQSFSTIQIECTDQLLGLVQVNGGVHSFNAVNAMRTLGRWMRMFTIPNQATMPSVYMHFENDGGSGAGRARLLPGSNRDRLVDVMEEFVKYTIVMRPHLNLFASRHSERKEAEAVKA